MAFTNIQNIELPLDQGDCADFLWEFFEVDGITPRDITGWEFASQIRELYNSPTILTAFTFVLGVAINEVHMKLTATQTAGLPILPALVPGVKRINTFSYDFKIKDETGCISTVSQGPVFVTPQVTDEVP